MKNHRGMTLIEIVIVLAIIAIIGAILIPNFLTATDKARLKSDVQSAQVIQSAIELYKSEQGRAPAGADMSAIIQVLCDAQYLRPSDGETQTDGADWQLDGDMGVIVDISGAEEDAVRVDAYSLLTDHEKLYVTGEK